MENDTLILNYTTERPEWSTTFWQTKKGREIRDISYDSALVFTGTCVIVFNMLMILLYKLQPKIRKHISFMLLQTFTFCLIHGFATAIIYPLHRALRYEMSPTVCVIGDLLLVYLADYLLLLLPLLAIERLIVVVNPFLKRKTMKLFCIISTTIALIIPMFTSWLPMIPETGIPTQKPALHANPHISQVREKFYYYFNCQNKLVKFNHMYPFMKLTLQTLCFLVVSSSYLRMFCIASRQQEQFSTQLKAQKAKRIRRAALSTFVIAITFFLFTWPYGLVEIIRDLQSTGYIQIVSDPDYWWQTGLALRFTFDCVERMGYFVAPLLFVMFNRKLRHALRDFVCAHCRKSSNLATGAIRSSSAQSREMARLNSTMDRDKRSTGTKD